MAAGTLNGKKVLNSGGWSGWQGMSGVDFIYNNARVSRHEVIYRSAATSSGSYYTSATISVCVNVDPNSTEGYITWCNTNIHCDLYSGDPSSGGSYISGRSTGVTYVDVSDNYFNFSFSGLYDTQLYFNIWCDNQNDSMCRVQASAGDTSLSVEIYRPPVYYNISVSGDSGCTVSGGGSVLEGSSTTIYASVKPGYTFDGWYENGSIITTNTSYTVTNVRSNRSFTAKTTRNIYYIRIYPSAGITSTTGAGENYYYGDVVNISLAYSLGYKFDAWYSDSSHTDVYKTQKSFSIVIDDSLNLYPNVIETDHYVVTVLAGDGVSEVFGGGSIPVGEETTINCTLEGEDFIFSHWSSDNSVFTTDQQYTFMPTDDITLIAEVKKCLLNVLPLNYISGTSGSGSHPVGRVVTLSATLDTSSEYFVDFDGWYMCAGGEIYGEKLSNNIVFDFKVPDMVFAQVGAVGRKIADPFVYINHEAEWLEYIPYVFINHEWKKAWQYTNKDNEWMIAL